MNKFLRIGLLAITTAFLGAGCVSSAYHAFGENEYPYNATTDCFTSCLCVWGRDPENELEQAVDAYTRMVYLFWVVDFPLEVVIDTVAFPIDGTIYLCQGKPKK